MGCFLIISYYLSTLLISIVSSAFVIGSLLSIILLFLQACLAAVTLKTRFYNFNNNVKLGKVPFIELWAKMAMPVPDSQWYPLKRCQIKYEFNINVYNFETWLFSIVVSLQKWFTHVYTVGIILNRTLP